MNSRDDLPPTTPAIRAAMTAYIAAHTAYVANPTDETKATLDAAASEYRKVSQAPPPGA